MNVIKNMEIIFIASAALFCAATWEAPAKVDAAPVVKVEQAAASQTPVQTVVITGRRSAA
ncbi:hypothetical protein V8J88_23545 [Massilia sp. W12]|uniref:hypothetical protein n=1 Tax=Massilia sp. W12 TaxID=3126507 RepID=UPI0030CB1D1B